MTNNRQQSEYVNHPGQPARLPFFRLVRSRRKTVELRIYPDKTLEIRAPQRMPKSEIDAFVASNQQWIERKLGETQAVATSPPWRCQQGANIYLMGQAFQLSLNVGNKCCERRGKWLYLSVPLAAESHYQTLLDEYLRALAYDQFQQQINQWFPYFAAQGHKQPRLRVKKMTSRWGSLSAKGNINLNLWLIHYPLELIESVVVHELCHLEHMNHGKQFKQLQAALLPDWRQRKKALEQFSVNVPQMR